MRLRSIVAALLGGVLALAPTSEANACGGSFRAAGEVSAGAVTDHRLVFKISRSETILWDQMRYSGSPSELAWVLPVREGSRLELSHDDWIAALDASTQSTTNVSRLCPASAQETGCSSSSPSSLGARTYGDGGTNVVVHQEVVGPYDIVTLRAKDGAAIHDWLTTNGFAIPEASRRILEQYTAEGFDFLALRLRPGQGIQAMQPVRVVMPGPNPALPLRMIGAGAGPRVGIRLWIIGEGRYRTQNLPNAVIDETKLFVKGDGSTNLADLQAATVADGRTWLTESARPPSPTLEPGYRSICTKLPTTTGPCTDAGAAVDGGAGLDAGVDAQAQSSAPPENPAPCVEQHGGCTDYDDADVAARGLDPANVWITRLRADLPLSSLDTDLYFEAAPREPVLAEHNVSDRNTKCEDNVGCHETRSAPIGSWTIAAVTALAAAAIARRRRR